MKEFTVGKNDANQRLDRWLSKNLPLLPAPLAQKYIRLKRVKLNGKGAKRDTRLQVGDLLQLYINDEFFEIPTPENAFLKLFKPKLDILYEDEHILLVNKAPGMVVHGDETERVNTLINHIQAYLYQKKEWNPFREHAFAPALCNRIDRNTGGIVIAAKTAEALRVMNQKIRDRELVKLYLCAIVGQIQPPDGTLKGYLEGRGQEAGLCQVPSRARRPDGGDQISDADQRTGAVPAGMRPDHRPHPPNPCPTGCRRSSPPGRWQIRQREAQSPLRDAPPGPLVLVVGVPVHHPCWGAGIPQRTALSGQRRGFRGGIFS